MTAPTRQQGFIPTFSFDGVALLLAAAGALFWMGHLASKVENLEAQYDTVSTRIENMDRRIDSLTEVVNVRNTPTSR